VRLLGKLARHRVLDRLDLVRGLLISICADLSLYVVGILSEELLGGRGQEPGDVPLVQGLEDLVGLADDADLPPAGSGRPLDRHTAVANAGSPFGKRVAGFESSYVTL
jgi:hypothetical protein